MRVARTGAMGLAVTALVLASVSGAAGGVGDKLLFDVQPITLEGRTLVPLRPIFEWLGAEVRWDGGHIQAWRSEEAVVPQVELWIGSTLARIAGAPYRLDVAPQLIKGRCFVPLRFVAESFGVWVDTQGSQMVLKLPQENIEAVMAIPPHPQTHQGKIWHVIERWYGVLPREEMPAGQQHEAAAPALPRWSLFAEQKQEELIAEIGPDAPTIVESHWGGREVKGIRVLRYRVSPGAETGWAEVLAGYADGETEVHRFDFVREADGWKIYEFSEVEPQ